VKQVAAQRIKLVGNAVVGFDIEREFAKNIVVKTEQGFGIGPRALISTFGKKLRDGEKAIGHALHRGDDHDDVGATRHRPHQFGSAQHALCAEQRGATELEGNDSLAMTKNVACLTDTCLIRGLRTSELRTSGLKTAATRIESLTIVTCADRCGSSRYMRLPIYGCAIELRG
jgi:hypothetical protein